jgi:hypothetical protein
MRVRRLAALMCFLVACLGIAAPGNAQPYQSVQLRGTIQAVDCDAQQLTFLGPNGPTVLRSTLATVLRVDGVATPLCDLAPLVGADATVSILAVGGQLVIAQLDATGAAAASAPPPTAPYAPPPAAPATVGPAPPIAGIVLGTVLFGGLVYLLVRSANGGLYRYPYYGPYYRAYYRPTYRPYAGPDRWARAYTYGPYRRCADGGWSQWCY